MRQFQKVMIVILIVFALLFIGSNLIFQQFKSNNIEKKYNVEISRIYQDIVASGYRENLDLSSYSFIDKVEYLSASSKGQQLNDFFDIRNVQAQIRLLIEKNGKLSGYLKFTYHLDIRRQFDNFQLAANIVIGISFIIVCIILVFTRQRIVKPFDKMAEMPAELAKGHLTKNLKEEKTQLGGRFIWGLNMLKDNLESSKNRMLQMEKEKKTLIISLSHDIKTPLSAIKLYTRALKEGLYTDEKKQHQVLSQIDKNTEEIEQFVSDIICASKEDFLHIEVQNQDFYLADLIHDLEKYYREKLQLVKTEFAIREFENCLLYGDRQRTLEALQNMIENAIKYGDGKEIAVEFHTEENYQLITIKNTGNTLPQRELVHIFDSFWRGSNVKNKNGSGLGLYICRQILTKMDGDIFASSNGDEISITVVIKKA